MFGIPRSVESYAMTRTDTLEKSKGKIDFHIKTAPVNVKSILYLHCSRRLTTPAFGDRRQTFSKHFGGNIRFKRENIFNNKSRSVDIERMRCSMSTKFLPIELSYSNLFLETSRKHFLRNECSSLAIQLKFKMYNRLGEKCLRRVGE